MAAAVQWWNLRLRRADSVKSSGTGSDSVPSARRSPKWIAITLVSLALVVSAGTTVQAILIGHSGAAAVWSKDMETPVTSGH